MLKTQMNKIMIIGCCGAGKSTLARALNSTLNIPLLYLDQYYWKPNWQASERNEWETTIKDLAAKESWIMDGNYKGTMDIRMAQADTIIMLNRSRYICMVRVMKRVLLNIGRVRADMPQGCKERFDFEFLKYVWNFNKTQGLALIEKLNAMKNEKLILIFDNDNEIKTFLKDLRNNNIPH